MSANSLSLQPYPYYLFPDEANYVSIYIAKKNLKQYESEALDLANSIKETEDELDNELSESKDSKSGGGIPQLMRKPGLKIKHFLWKIKNIFHKYSKEDKELIKKNKKLIKEFPFLRVRVNRFGKVPTDYDYTYTELDDMPTAWRESFGIEMCEKIKKCLLKADYLDKYVITQIKEVWNSSLV